MNTTIHFKKSVVAVILLGFVGTAVGEEYTPTAEVLATAVNTNQYIETLAGIDANRYAIIDGIVAMWEPTWGEQEGWKEEFTIALQSMTDAQLMDIQKAASYDGVRAILQGKAVPVTPSGSEFLGAEALGDLSEDLVFTPVTPCRIFDTRYSVAGTPPGGNPGTIRSYFVKGTAATLAPQGHNKGVASGPGCLAPKNNAEPVGIAANFTVVPHGKGHIRVWPFTEPQPNASFLNYNTPVNSNLANAGVFKTCYNCGKDIYVSTWFGSADSLADVLGYFYPATGPGINFSDGSGGDIVIDLTNDHWGVLARIPANPNYRNFTIPVGRTLVVPAGTTIRCSGTFQNDGLIHVFAGNPQNNSSSFPLTNNSASSGPQWMTHPGDTPGAATAGQFDNNAISVTKQLMGGRGGFGIPQAIARNSFGQFKIGGGAGSGFFTGSNGGGLLKVYCDGSIVNTGTISANGSNGSSSNGGGGGGIVILASQTSVTNSTGTINVNGGNGNNAATGAGISYYGAGGGGGGGIVIMMSPTAPVLGTVNLNGGTGGSAGTVDTQSRMAGGGGGASGGFGGIGGSVLAGASATANAGANGSPGYAITITANPAYLAR